GNAVATTAGLCVGVGLGLGVVVGLGFAVGWGVLVGEGEAPPRMFDVNRNVPPATARTANSPSNASHNVRLPRAAGSTTGSAVRPRAAMTRSSRRCTGGTVLISDVA